jgi:hypothetical protein
VAQILVPTTSHEDWKDLLASPDRHWKPGYSAMTLARSWQDANGFPPEIRATLATSPYPNLHAIEPLLIIPEFKVPLPGGDRASQTDVFVLARAGTGLVTIAVEGKVDEAFGPTIAERRRDATSGVETRLESLLKCMELSSIPESCRYQLLHRTASAVLAAQQFFAKTAIMLVHSFSPTDRWFDDFAEFAKTFGGAPPMGQLISIGERGGVDVYIGWCKGDQRFRQG